MPVQNQNNGQGSGMRAVRRPAFDPKSIRVGGVYKFYIKTGWGFEVYDTNWVKRDSYSSVDDEQAYVIACVTRVLFRGSYVEFEAFMLNSDMVHIPVRGITKATFVRFSPETGMRKAVTELSEALELWARAGYPRRNGDSEYDEYEGKLVSCQQNLRRLGSQYHRTVENYVVGFNQNI